MIFGGYKIAVSIGSLPQKVASGFDKLFEGWTGAKYNIIAYLGNKVTNGTNHALLVKQTLIYAEDVTTVGILVLNEKPGDVNGDSLSFVSYTPVLSNGGPLGGVQINATTKIPPEVQSIFDSNFKFGADEKAFALLASQMGVNGGVYALAVNSKMVIDPEGSVRGGAAINLVKVYGDGTKPEIITILEGAEGGLLASESEKKEGNLGYAFTWLSKQWP